MQAGNPIANRYQITDPVCGLVAATITRSEALRVAKRHAKECAGVEIFDIMARTGAWDTYRADGTGISRR